MRDETSDTAASHAALKHYFKYDAHMAARDARELHPLTRCDPSKVYHACRFGVSRTRTDLNRPTGLP